MENTERISLVRQQSEVIAQASGLIVLPPLDGAHAADQASSMFWLVTDILRRTEAAVSKPAYQLDLIDETLADALPLLEKLRVELRAML